MQTPVVNAQQAGLAAASADMNNYAYACQFLLRPPMVLAAGQGSAQSLTGGVGTAINWAQPALDNDSTWSAGSPSQFTLQTLGYYDVAAHVPVTSAAGSGTGYIQITNGPNNPAGAGQTFGWHASFNCDGVASLVVAGPTPVLCYPGDFIQVFITVATTCTTTQLNSAWPDYSHKLVSL